MQFKYPSHHNYDKFPFIAVKGYDTDSCYAGWENISNQLQQEFENFHKEKLIVVAECYTGIYDDVAEIFKEKIKPAHFFHTSTAFKTTDEINQLVFPDITDDEIFGKISRLDLSDFLDAEKSARLKEEIKNVSKGIILVYGTAASLLADADVFIYLDMPRWEGQLRFRRNEVANLGAGNKSERPSMQYKRAYFVDWRVCDKQKIKTMPQWNFVIDTVDSKNPKMIDADAYRSGLKQTAERPFRVVPFFDPGPWGGQWMKSVCDLDKTTDNYAWCFDCVPEENSLLLKFGDILFETPSINLVFFQAEALLGKAVFDKFGAEFPIRFDFLDTMEGGNLSLQVHPLTEYIRKNFRMDYTQDESYYLLDAGDDACVYLGLKEDIQPRQMLDDLRLSLSTAQFDAESYVEKWQARKHDHFLIPAGTVHCSGANAMVLEISATPYIFTFKLWDWDRLGLDGRPRPINIDHGEKVIQWKRKTTWTKENLVNRIKLIAEGDGWKEEKTGLHELEFIECRRHWFTKKVIHQNPHGVNVLNLVEGAEVIIESPENEFDAFVVHYAETFIIPAGIKEYSIRPYGKADGTLCATIKAFIR